MAEVQNAPAFAELPLLLLGFVYISQDIRVLILYHIYVITTIPSDSRSPRVHARVLGFGCHKAVGHHQRTPQRNSLLKHSVTVGTPSTARRRQSECQKLKQNLATQSMISLISLRQAHPGTGIDIPIAKFSHFGPKDPPRANDWI